MMARNGMSRDVCLHADHELPGSGNPQVRLLEPSPSAGYAPRGSSPGFFGLTMLSGAVPFAMTRSLLPVFKVQRFLPGNETEPLLGQARHRRRFR